MRSRVLLGILVTVLTVQGCAVTPTTNITEKPPPPATGDPVVLDEHPPGWATSAWLADGQFCVRAARTGEHREGKANEFISCDPASEALTTTGPPLLPSKPNPYTAPQDPHSQKIILVGTVRGAVATVSVTMFDTTATAAVHQLPSTAGRQAGAYAVWLPRSGPERDGMNLTDITAVVGRDTAGNVVTSLD